MRPGDRLRALARRICARDTIEHIIDPLIADLQFEHAKAVRAGLVWCARRVRLGGYLGFWKSVLMCAGRCVHGWAAADQHALGRTLAFCFAVIAALTALLALIPLYAVRPWRAAHVSSVTLFVYVVPQAVPLAIIFGLPIGILCGLRGRSVNGRVVASVLSAAVVITIVTFVVVAWIIPDANQAFRLLITGQEFLRRGDNELTLWELRSRLDDWTTPVAYARSYYLRWAISFAPIVLGLFAVSLSAIRRRTSTSLIIGVLASVMYVALGVLLVLGPAASRLFASLPVSAAFMLLPVWATVWLPNLMFAGIAIILFACAKRAPPPPSRP